MNTKLILAALASTFIGSTAFALEPTQFADAPSTLSRVQAQALDARSPTVIASNGEATQFASDATASRRTRDDVRAEAEAAPLHAGMVDCPYVGG
ncbi:MAG TPA: hypothetical protein VGE16_18140 [Albitalea sp.]